MELVVDLERIYQRKKAANKELVELVKTTGTGLLDLHGIGPSGAARLLVEVGDITRFPDRGHFASWTGTAPIDASSGDQCATACPAAGTGRSTWCCTSWPPSSCATATEGRAYYDRKVAAGKSPNEAMRCLKRRLSDIVYRTMLNDLRRRTRRRAREDTGARHLIQRGRLTAPHRLFGQVTSRTRHHQA